MHSNRLFINGFTPEWMRARVRYGHSSVSKREKKEECRSHVRGNSRTGSFLPLSAQSEMSARKLVYETNGRVLCKSRRKSDGEMMT